MSKRSSESTSRDPKRFPWAPPWRHLHPPSKNSTSSISFKVVSPPFLCVRTQAVRSAVVLPRGCSPIGCRILTCGKVLEVLTDGEPQTFGRGFDLWMRSPLTTNAWTGGFTFPGSLELGKKSISFFGSKKCPYHPVSFKNTYSVNTFWSEIMCRY